MGGMDPEQQAFAIGFIIFCIAMFFYGSSAGNDAEYEELNKKLKKDK